MTFTSQDRNVNNPLRCRTLLVFRSTKYCRKQNLPHVRSERVEVKCANLVQCIAVEERIGKVAGHIETIEEERWQHQNAGALINCGTLFDPTTS
jgi:hypothetical protein